MGKYLDDNSTLFENTKNKIIKFCHDNDISCRACSCGSYPQKAREIYGALAINDDKYNVYFNSGSRGSFIAGSKYARVSAFTSVSLVEWVGNDPKELDKVHINTLEDVDAFFEVIKKWR